MFRATDIMNRLRRQPFRSMRIIASEGLRFDVYHPDLVWVGERYVHIGTPSTQGNGIFAEETIVAIVHIVGLEDLPVPTTPAPTVDATTTPLAIVSRVSGSRRCHVVGPGRPIG